MKKKAAAVILLLALLCLMLAGCGKTTKIPVNVESDSLYVKKVENLKDDFIFGMDASSVLAEEASGVKYYNSAGEEQDVFKTLAENGITHIRVRIWNNPYDKDGNGYGGGNCDINTAVEIGKRATRYGLSLIVNFHYSDFWADPGKQMVPLAWKGMSVEEKSDALYKYTKDCLKKLKAAKVNVGMVQIDNRAIAHSGKHIIALLGGTHGMQQRLVGWIVARGAHQTRHRPTSAGAVGDNLLGVTRHHVIKLAQVADGGFQVQDGGRSTARIDGLSLLDAGFFIGFNGNHR